MKRSLLIVLLAAFAVSAEAQEAPHISSPPAKLSQFETWVVQGKTVLDGGARHRIVYTSDADTAVVWTNLQGEPRLFRARLGGEVWARTLTAGTFPISDSLAMAYEWMQDATFRRQLEALLEDDAVIRRSSR